MAPVRAGHPLGDAAGRDVGRQHRNADANRKLRSVQRARDGRTRDHPPPHSTRPCASCECRRSPPADPTTSRRRSAHGRRPAAPSAGRRSRRARQTPRRTLAPLPRGIPQASAKARPTRRAWPQRAVPERIRRSRAPEPPSARLVPNESAPRSPPPRPAVPTAATRSCRAAPAHAVRHRSLCQTGAAAREPTNKSTPATPSGMASTPASPSVLPASHVRMPIALRQHLTQHTALAIRRDRQRAHAQRQQTAEHLQNGRGAGRSRTQ